MCISNKIQRVVPIIYLSTTSVAYFHKRFARVSWLHWDPSGGNRSFLGGICQNCDLLYFQASNGSQLANVSVSPFTSHLRSPSMPFDPRCSPNPGRIWDVRNISMFDSFFRAMTKHPINISGVVIHPQPHASYRWQRILQRAYVVSFWVVRWLRATPIWIWRGFQFSRYNQTQCILDNSFSCMCSRLQTVCEISGSFIAILSG